MEQVFYQAHIKASNYILRHTSHRTRSIIEHLALGLAVCSFCVVIITHRTFIHREDNIASRSSCDVDQYDDYYSNHSLIEEGRNVSILYSTLIQLLLRVTAWTSQWSHLSSTLSYSSSTTITPSPSMWSKKIPISCLKSIPGFRDDADVNHVLLHLLSRDNNAASNAFTIHRGRENEQIVSGNIEEDEEVYSSCIIGSECKQEITTFLAQRGYLSMHVNNNANDNPPLLFPKEKEKTPNASSIILMQQQQQQQQHQPQQYSSIVYSYSHTQGLLRLKPSLQHTHNISTQFIIVSPTDTNCFGEPFTQNIIFRFIGPDTVILNWILGLQSSFSSHSSTTSTTTTTTTTATFHQRPRFVHHWKTHTELDLDVYDKDHYAFSSKSSNSRHQSSDTTTSTTAPMMYEAVSPSSLPVATMNMLLSSSPTWVVVMMGNNQYPLLYRLLRFLSFKSLVLASTLLIFFLTTSLVSFTFQETQDRMLEFTFQLQSRVRANLPLQTLIFDHVLENLVFVPIMVGMIFFLIEFYGDDKFLAFMVLSMVWVCEVFSAISVRSVQGMHFFPRVFFLYFTLFHVYFFSCPVGVSYPIIFELHHYLCHNIICTLFPSTTDSNHVGMLLL